MKIFRRCGQILFGNYSIFRDNNQVVAMALINNPTQVIPIAKNDDLTLVQAQLDSSKKVIFKQILNSSLSAVLKLSKENLINSPCHKFVAFKLRKGANIRSFEAINLKRIKQWFSKALASTVFEVHHHMNQCSDESINDFKLIVTQNIFTETMKQKLLGIFQILQGKINEEMAYQNDLNCLQIEWKQSMLIQMIEDSMTLIGSCRNLGEIAELTKIPQQSGQREIMQSNEGDQISKFKHLLSKLSGSNKIKIQLYKLFQANILSLKQKERELQDWNICQSSMQETVKQQMKWIKIQDIQNVSLQEKIEQLEESLRLSDERLLKIERQTEKLQSQFLLMKKSSEQESYYMNPMYQKGQIEEKILIEMIEIESDLLLKKDQIKGMTDSIIEIIKACKNSFEEIQASRYFFSNFNRSVMKIVKDIKSFESIDLEAVLNLKEDSLYESQYLEDTRKSGISTYSEIDLDQKMSRLTTEDDCLSIIQEDQ